MTQPRFLLLLLLLGTPWLPTGAQARPGPAGKSPDVLILVAAMPNGQDQIGITYAGMIPHAQARRDVAVLRAVTGWPLKHVRITDAPSSLAWDKTKMTGVECVTGRVVLPATHGLVVQPFVQAFRVYPHVQLTYFVGDGFPFQGLHDYSDDHVRITLERHGDAFTYQIFIRDSRWERLNLPYLQPPSTDAHVLPVLPRPGVKPWLLALVAVAAIGSGCVAYALLNRTA